MTAFVRDFSQSPTIVTAAFYLHVSRDIGSYLHLHAYFLRNLLRTFTEAKGNIYFFMVTITDVQPKGLGLFCRRGKISLLVDAVHRFFLWWSFLLLGDWVNNEKLLHK